MMVISCSICNSPGSDLQLIGCGCTFHAVCFPLPLILDKNNNNKDSDDNKTASIARDPETLGSCPCSSRRIQGIRLLPLCFGPLKAAIDLRKREALEAASSSSHQRTTIGEETAAADEDATNTFTGKKRNRDEFSRESDFEIEAAHAVYSQGKPSYFSNTPESSECHRTGRWTSEETAYSDALVQAFDEGRLPLPQDTKLLPFLSDALLCKPTRLTKKMKKAKLSSRSFQLLQQPPQQVHEQQQQWPTSSDVFPKPEIAKSHEDASSMVNLELLPADPAQEPPSNTTIVQRSLLIELQDRFLLAMPCEYDRLEYRFNLEKQWRTYFSEMCIQAGFPVLDASPFLESLEEYDRLASNAEELMRSVRRRKMGLDCGGISRAAAAATAADDRYSGNPATLESSFSNQYTIGAVSEESSYPPSRKSENHMIEDDDQLDASFVQLMNITHDEPATPPTNSSAIQSAGTAAAAGGGTSPLSFLDAIVAYLEKFDLPFQHADCWVPSIVDNNSNNNGTTPSDTKDNQDQEPTIHLVHAGHSTRRDQGSNLRSAFDNFGNYSKAFSFLPTKGLVGRVYSSAQLSWEFGLNNLDPDFFLRAGGAEEYGVQTAVGIPICTPGVGRIVVVLYSCHEVPQDDSTVKLLEKELTRLVPQPKWKLVVEVGAQDDEEIPLSVPQNEQDEEQRTMAANNKRRQEPALTASSRTSTTGTTVGRQEEEEEKKGDDDDGDERIQLEIISLLGDQLTEIQSRDNRGAENDEHALLFRQFMAMRLMLLKPSNRRSFSENEALGILKSSYQCYSASMRRRRSSSPSPPPSSTSGSSKTKGDVGRLMTKPELAALLVNEWRYLWSSRDEDETNKNHQEQPFDLQSLSSSASSSSSSRHNTAATSSSLYLSTSCDHGAALCSPGSSVGKLEAIQGGNKQHRSYELAALLPPLDSKKKRGN